MGYAFGQPLFKGSLVALITPFKNGAVDENAFRKLVDWQIEQGTHGLVPVGTTGESPTLSHAEHKRVIELCIEQTAGRVPVIAGAGSNSTQEAVEFTEHAAEAGADAVLHVMPYYNKPTQEGMFRHFEAINNAVDIPIIIYNIPGRSIVDMSVDTMKRCYEELKNVTGVKDATADLVRPIKQRMAMGSDFCQLTGEDASVLPFLSHGGHGCISVTANVAPKQLSEMHVAWQNRDLDTAFAINERLQPLHAALFSESSPGPVKYAASLLGICESTARLPIYEIADENKAKVESAMRHAGLLN
ncbi:MULTISPECIES: 4-hydroxy-tetrahydrodipicolinate synthase [Thalassobaculum]|uniref:4-hydroxy-tetrahydrodipicolinate synthase n=1 Tax=Thalassobaculum litoreum DSM 18839 TaxID=1123362 RepID=A0A8G2EXC9_9PROT|nr:MULTISPECIES: 4-hydroxy-tetrahydrodipicolinate synthase [Thalassobaculum]SDF15051.1 4-hydroxy-tetrahydrodipicolinate synthase [Thalassobaculum litoreum DSM 18839]